jgi:hypothetical protein
MTYCVNHPDAAVTAYCQDCGKGLCSACARTVQGNIYCEEHATVRTTGAAGAPSGVNIPGGMPGGMPGSASYPPGMPPPASGTNTGSATLLGFIPGVGAMYNGQYIKALVHVVVFVILMGMADRYWFFWLLLAFWVLYQVFDAHQTAHARKYGLPLPDPFGLNELGNRIGGHAVPPPVNPGAGMPPGVAGTGAPGSPANPYMGPAAEWGRQADVWGEQVRQQAHQWGEQAGQWGEQIRAKVVAETQARAAQPGARWGGGPVTQGFTATATPPPPPSGWATPPPGAWAAPGQAPPVPPVPPVPPIPQMELERARREPIGAIVLIILGMLFLLNTMGFFSFGWVGHGWPLVIVAIAVWLLMRNARGHMGFMPHMGAKPGNGPGDAAQDVSASQHENQPGGEK